MPDGDRMKDVWTDTHGSVCQIAHTRNGVRLASGSGFFIGGRLLITNNHVIQAAAATHATIRIVDADGHTPVQEHTLATADFQARLRDGGPEGEWDFAILDMDVPELENVPGLTLAPSDDVTIGTRVALLGFQFEQENLSLHAGGVASTYVQADVDYIQLDASVNHGNSGGPLLDVESGGVIGVITRKATGLTNQFDELLASFDENAKAFEAVQGTVGLAGLDVFKILTITQNQMKRVSVEMRRSANVGIGYAYSLRKIRHSLQTMGVL